MPRITCPTCGVELGVATDSAGEVVECGGCRASFVIPAGEDRPGRPPETANRLAVLSLILGTGSLSLAVSSVVCCAGVVAGPLAVVAITLGVLGLKRGSIKGFAVAGIVTGGLAILVLLSIAAYVGLSMAANPAIRLPTAPPPQGS
jgi:hypothetical protein